MFYAIGMIFGPGIGGLLAELGAYINAGFMLPFEVLGVFIIFGALLAQCLITNESKFILNLS